MFSVTVKKLAVKDFFR